MLDRVLITAHSPLNRSSEYRAGARRGSRARVLGFESLEDRRLLAIDMQLAHSFLGAAADGEHADAVPTIVGSTIYGTTSSGGSGDNLGTIYSVNTDGSNFHVLHVFTGAANDGSVPFAGLTVVGSTLYGTTYQGGTGGTGTIFSIDTSGANFTVLHSFTGGNTDGAYPFAGLTASGSVLYGATNNGGTAGLGTLFSIGTNGTGFTVLHSFTGTASDGAHPFATMTLVGATLYGTTNDGGTADEGTVFSVGTNGSSFQVLHSFTGTASDGATPYATLAINGSTIYGTTNEGGTANEGTVFSVATNGANFTVLHSFTGTASDGANARAGVILVGANLYGTTIGGGAAHDGTVYSVSTTGTNFQVLHSFSGTSSDGTLPFAGLVAVGSTLYGVTDGGESGPNKGTLFTLSTAGANFHLLHTFMGAAADGAYSNASLVQVGSTLYGTTVAGGSDGYGTVFSISADGSNFQVLHSFKGGDFDGVYPFASLTLVGSTLYGTTAYGGTIGNGTLYSISTSGANFQVLYSFGQSGDGDSPMAGVVAVGSTLYGTTHGGGVDGNGIVYAIGTNGANYQILHYFTASTTDGGVPDGQLTVKGSTLYGTTDVGGSAGFGTVFAIDTNGANFHLLHSFTNAVTDGMHPRTGVTIVGSTIYGTTIFGGAAGKGTVFSLSTAGTGFQLLHSFTDTNGDGAVPFSTLTALGSTLYGTTNGGVGGQTKGTVFSLNTNGTNYQVLHVFNGGSLDGSYAYGAPIVVGSALFGTTNSGGPQDSGTIYSLTGALPAGPQVSSVQVTGSGWAPGFLSTLATTGHGNGSGYAIPVGSASQLTPLPWVDLNQIQIVFNQDVHVVQNSLVLTGTAGPYAITGFSYSTMTHMATWTVAGFGADRLHIALASTGPNAVTDGAGNPLDGEWTDSSSSYLSGDGSAGGDFNFAFNVLPGDVNQDGIVSLTDLTAVASNWHQQGLLGQANGDGVVNLTDLTGIASNWLHTLPAGGGGAGASLAAGLVVDSNTDDGLDDDATTVVAAAAPPPPLFDQAAAAAAAVTASPVAASDAATVGTATAALSVAAPSPLLTNGASASSPSPAPTIVAAPAVGAALSSGVYGPVFIGSSLALTPPGEGLSEFPVAQPAERLATFLGHALLPPTAASVDNLMSTETSENDAAADLWSVTAASSRKPLAGHWSARDAADAALLGEPLLLGIDFLS